MNKNARVSIVIPVYNEAEQIRACLAAIAVQTVAPFEVIVVDNNSSDATAQIAESFPFVTLLREPRQGVVFARDRGFNAARGEIIGRIDADSRISSDWVATLQRLFSDKTLGAVTGTVTYRDIAAHRLVNRIDLFWRRRMARLLGRDVALQGANMAISRKAWRAVKDEVCHASGLHEDFDLAIHATQVGYNVRFDERLRAAVCYRQADYNIQAFSHYALISPATYAAHRVTSGRHMYQVVAFVIICYPIIKVLHRGYDQYLGRFSWNSVISVAVTARVNPATFVD